MSTPIADVRAALRTRWLPLLKTDERDQQLALEGRTFVPKIGTPYWREFLVTGARRRMSIQPIRLEMAGAYFIDVFEIPGEGLRAATAKAEAIAAAFGPDGVEVTSGAQVVRIGGQVSGASVSIGRALTLPDWIQLPITVPWSTNIYQ